MKKLTSGIDIGGTNVKLGIINPAGKVVAKSNFETESYLRNKNKLIKAVIGKIKEEA